MGSQKGQKSMAIEVIEQIWNSVDAIVIAVATLVVAILEQQQRRFRVRYLTDFDMQFPNREDTCSALPFTLILYYKRRHT